MSRTLSIRNRQRVRRIDTALLRRITLHVLKTQLGVTKFELAIHLVTAPEMARVNETFLNHKGSTDVITFDYSVNSFRVPRSGFRVGAHSNELKTQNSEPRTRLHGELFICVDDAVKQAREFRTTWQSEIVRYVIHGLLHLRGYDDLKPAARRQMKVAEGRLLREVIERFPLAKLGTRNPKPGTRKSSIVNHQS
jgi:probable rRNA maturation factor